MNPKLIDQLAGAKQLLLQITEGDFAEHRTEVDALMSTICQLGMALHIEPGLTGTQPVAALLQEAHARLQRLLLSMDLYIINTEFMLTAAWEGDEWFSVCRRRSALEFLRTLLAISDEDAPDLEDLDHLLIERGEEECIAPPGGVDTGIPTSHWWWFCNWPKQL